MPEQEQPTGQRNNPPPAYRVPHKISANTTVNSDSDEEDWSDASFPDGPVNGPNPRFVSREQPTQQTHQPQFRPRLSLPSRHHVYPPSTDPKPNPFPDPTAATGGSRNHNSQNNYGQATSTARPTFNTHGLTSGTVDSAYNPHGPTAGPSIAANGSSFGGHHSYYAGDYMIPYHAHYNPFAPPPSTTGPPMYPGPHRPIPPPPGHPIPQYPYAIPPSGYPNGNFLGNQSGYAGGYPNYHYPTHGAVPPTPSFSPPKVSIRPPPAHHPQPHQPQGPPPRYSEQPKTYHPPRRGNSRAKATTEREYEGAPGRRQGQRKRGKSTSRPAAYIEDDLDDTVIRDREILQKAEERMRAREKAEQKIEEKAVEKEVENAKKISEREKELERKVRQLESEREKEKERQLFEDKVQVAVDHILRRSSNSTNRHEPSSVGNPDFLLRELEAQRVIDDLSRLLPHPSDRFGGGQDVFSSLSPTLDHSTTVRDLLERSLRANPTWNPSRTSPQAVPQRPDNGISAVVIHELLQRMRKLEQSNSAILRQKATTSSSSIYGVPEEENDDNQNDLGYIFDRIHRLEANIGTGPDTKRLREGEVGDNYSTDGTQSDIPSTVHRSTTKGRSAGDLGIERPRTPRSTTHTQPRQAKHRPSTPRRRTAHFEDQPEAISTTPPSHRGSSNMNTKAPRQAAVHQAQDEYESESDALSRKLKREPRKYAKAGFSIREPRFEGARPPPSVPDPPMAPPS